MTNKKCPCKDCICVPVCRHKSYTPMIEECFFLLELLYKDKTAGYNHRKQTFQTDVLQIEEIINPIKWRTGRHPDGNLYIAQVVGYPFNYGKGDIGAYIRKENQ